MQNAPGHQFPLPEFVERNGVFDVNAEAHDGSRAAVLVVAGIRDVLVVDRNRDAAPDVSRVVGLENLFQAVVQRAIAQDEAQSSQSQIAPWSPEIPFATNAAPTLS